MSEEDPRAEDTQPYRAPSTSVGSGGDSHVTEGGLSSGVILHLRQTRPWVLVLSSLGLIACALTLVAAGVTMVAAIAFGGALPVFLTSSMALATGVLWLVPTTFLRRYAQRIGELVRQPCHPRLERAMKTQRLFWLSAGIVTLLHIGLTLVVPVLLRLVVGGAW